MEAPCRGRSDDEARIQIVKRSPRPPPSLLAASSARPSERSVTSCAIPGGGLQSVLNQALLVTTKQPGLCVVQIAFHVVSDSRVAAKPVCGPAVAYAAFPLGAVRVGYRSHPLLSPECGGPIAFATVLCRTQKLEPLSAESNKSSARGSPRKGPFGSLGSTPRAVTTLRSLTGRLGSHGSVNSALASEQPPAEPNAGAERDARRSCASLVARGQRVSDNI